jgi:hypothetical protein
MSQPPITLSMKKPAEDEDAEQLYVNAIELSDEDIEEGMVEEVEEGEVDDRCLEGVPLPTFDDEKRLFVKSSRRRRYSAMQRHVDE